MVPARSGGRCPAPRAAAAAAREGGQSGAGPGRAAVRGDGAGTRDRGWHSGSGLAFGIRVGLAVGDRAESGISRYGRWRGVLTAGARRREGGMEGGGSADGAGDGVSGDQDGTGRAAFGRGKGEISVRAAWPQFL